MCCSITRERLTALLDLRETFKMLALKSSKLLGGLMLVLAISWVKFPILVFALFMKRDHDSWRNCVFPTWLLINSVAWFSVQGVPILLSLGLKEALRQCNVRISIAAGALQVFNVLVPLRIEAYRVPCRYWWSYWPPLCVVQICSAWTSPLDFYEIRKGWSGNCSLLIPIIHAYLISMSSD